MYFIVFLIAIIFSAILSFITYGVINFGSHKEWWGIKDIPVGYFFLLYSVISFIIFKLKFKSVGIFKFFLLRNLIRFNRIEVFKKIDNNVYSTNNNTNSLQEKSIGVWNLLLNDKSSVLNASLLSYSRVIQRGSLLVVLKDKSEEHTLVVMDTDKLNLFYEVYIPKSYSKQMMSCFDKENEKRMNSVENEMLIQLESQLAKIV